MRHIIRHMCALMIAHIRLYQRIFAFARQYPHCKYMPCCSEYAILALQKHGIAKGVAYGAWRLLRCNPFSVGGVDLP